jgi:hypothetical protein
MASSMSADGFAVLTTLGEAGGIAGIVAVVFGLLIRMIKKNGCTCKFYNCSGGPMVEVDCEEGAPGKRYLPKEVTPSTTQNTTPAPSLNGAAPHRVVRPSDVDRV